MSTAETVTIYEMIDEAEYAVRDRLRNCQREFVDDQDRDWSRLRYARSRAILATLKRLRDDGK